MRKIIKKILKEEDLDKSKTGVFKISKPLIRLALNVMNKYDISQPDKWRATEHIKIRSFRNELSNKMGVPENEIFKIFLISYFNDRSELELAVKSGDLSKLYVGPFYSLDVRYYDSDIVEDSETIYDYCYECDGDGETNVECRRCDGTGEVEYYEETEDCEDCDGVGHYSEECDYCEGSGETEEEEYYNSLDVWEVTAISKYPFDDIINEFVDVKDDAEINNIDFFIRNKDFFITNNYHVETIDDREHFTNYLEEKAGTIEDLDNHTVVSENAYKYLNIF